MHQPNISAMRMRMRFDSLMPSQAARVFFIDDARITMRGEWNFVQHFSVRLWRLRLWHISSHSSHFSYRHSSPMTTPSPAHSVVVCVVIFPFVVALLPFQWWDDRGDGRKDRPFVGRDLRDELTWIIITAARLMFLFFSFFYLIANWSARTYRHIFYFSLIHTAIRARPRSSPPLIFYPFWLAVSLLTSPTIWAYEFISHQIESPFSPCAGWPVDGWTGRHPAETNGRNGDISRILDCTSKESQKNMESAIYIVFLHHNTIYCDSPVSLHKIHNDTHSILLWMDGWIEVNTGAWEEEEERGSWLPRRIHSIDYYVDSIDSCCLRSRMWFSLSLSLFVCCTLLLLLLSLDLQSLCVFTYILHHVGTDSHPALTLLSSALFDLFIMTRSILRPNRFIPAYAM